MLCSEASLFDKCSVPLWTAVPLDANKQDYLIAAEILNQVRMVKTLYFYCCVSWPAYIPNVYSSISEDGGDATQ